LNKLTGQKATPSPSAVSVIIPVRNCAETISRSLESVLEQDFTDYEIIVVDDGSTDGTREVVEKFGERIRLFRQEGRGAAAARNRAIGESRGRYLAFLDADDTWLPGKLSLQYEYLEAHPTVGLVYSDLATFDSGGELSSSYDSHHRKIHQGMVFDKLFLKNFIGTITVMARRECFDRAGLFPESFTHSSDWHQWLRIAMYYPVGYLDKPLARYRWSASSLTSRMEAPYPSRIEVIKDMQRIFPEYFRRRRFLYRRALAGCLFRYGYANFHQGDEKAAALQFLRALKNNPLLFKPYIYLLIISFPPAIRAKLLKLKRILGLHFMPAE